MRWCRIRIYYHLQSSNTPLLLTVDFSILELRADLFCASLSWTETEKKNVFLTFRFLLYLHYSLWCETHKKGHSVALYIDTSLQPIFDFSTLFQPRMPFKATLFCDFLGGFGAPTFSEYNSLIDNCRKLGQLYTCICNDYIAQDKKLASRQLF